MQALEEDSRSLSGMPVLMGKEVWVLRLYVEAQIENKGYCLSRVEGQEWTFGDFIPSLLEFEFS